MNQDQRTRHNLERHKKIMEDLIRQGDDKQTASKKAYDDVPRLRKVWRD